MRYCVITGLLISLALALSPGGSFRYQSTAFLFEDDYDLLFDPARIPLIQGSRVYTNLSNFVSNEEEQFGFQTENFFLIGGSTDLIGYIYPGAVLDRYCQKIPLPTGLLGRDESDTLRGDAKTIETEWLDLDGNGSYDHRVTVINERKAWDESSIIDYYLGLGFKMSDLRLGLGFLNNSETFTYTDPTYNWIRSRTDSSLISGALTYTINDTFTGPDKFKKDSKRFILSGWYDFEQLSVGIMTGFTPIARDSNYVHIGKTFEDRSPANPAIQDYDKATMLDSLTKHWSGVSIPIGLSVFYKPKGNIDSRFFLNFFTGSEKLDKGAGSFQHNTMDSTGRPGYAKLDERTEHIYRGGSTSKGFNFKTIQLFKVSERFDLGFGLGFGAWDFQDSLADTLAQDSVYEYNNGDTIAGTEDYRVRTKSSQEWLRKVSGAGKTFSIPVGFDFRLVPSLSLRLGAIHQVVWTDITTTDLLRAFEPTHTRIEYGDSTFTEQVEPASELQATSETTRKTEHSTYFTYGLGFNPVKNLAIDIMGFRNLTNLTNWKLSVTFKF
uniref:DUF5723 domain-containing protein n=1 Tax=candidate division WOR-3 bacterium TaxID=2052148 RepID=A0A7C6A8X8_UNCW3